MDLGVGEEKKYKTTAINVSNSLLDIGTTLLSKDLMDKYSNLPEQEVKRLKALHQLLILDSPYECLFDTITRATSSVCKTPMALITFVDEDRQWFKSKVGIEGVTETPREGGLCYTTILSNEILEIPDALSDSRFNTNAFITGNPFVRFYAGAPIIMPLGERIGSLCVMDTIPNHLNEYQKLALEGFSKVVAQALLVRNINTKFINTNT